MLRTLGLAAAIALGLSLPGAAANADSFTFVALGDMPYGKPAEVFPPFEVLIDTINARGPEFVIHIGDTKAGSTPCDDAILFAQLRYLNSFQAPTIYTPGDNEWTDCHRSRAGEFDPLERLAYIRDTYFTNPGRSFGIETMAVESQALTMADRYATYVENTRFEQGGVHFIQAHVVGSNNNFQIRSQEAVTEFFERDAANLAWLEYGFAEALEDDADAIVVSIHADMFWSGFGPFWDREGFLGESGFKNFGELLVAQTAAFGKPVLLIYGDSHEFTIHRPFPKGAPNLTALQVFGARDMHAVEIIVDTDTPGIFSIAPLLNPALDG